MLVFKYEIHTTVGYVGTFDGNGL